MSIIQSNADALLIGIPMVAVMFAGLFRIDEAFASPKKREPQGHPLCDWDENGNAICIQPDGKRLRQVSRK